MIVFKVFLPTLVHYTFHYIFTLFVVLMTLLLVSLGADKTSQRVLRFWAHTIFLSMGRRIHFKGMENFERHKPYLVLINHSSLFDIPAVMSILPEGSWIGREKLLRIPIFGRALKKTNYIPIDPSNWRKSLNALTRAGDHAEEGLKVLMFPEGTRSKNGELGNFKRGFLHIARKAEIDILPITINGLFRLRSRYQRYIDTAEKIEIIINEPIPYAQLKDMSDQEILQSAKRAIESQYQNR